MSQLTHSLTTRLEADEKYNRRHLPSTGYRPRAHDIRLGWSSTDEVAFREDGGGPDPLVLTQVIDLAARLILIQEVHFEDERAVVEERCLALIARWRRYGGPRSLVMKRSGEKDDFDQLSASTGKRRPEASKDWCAPGVPGTIVMDGGAEFHNGGFDEALASLEFDGTCGLLGASPCKVTLERCSATMMLVGRATTIALD